ncbi:MAG: hypothetical protein IKW23_02850 [Kiritimatiellae bacterium]|nr:hypothetical protein [Kiritimatiellia bacterium]MBR4946395.1 hypothetical protein [Kiritimatiellia bacterium]MBR5587770.1 hypothetical protein [Kiritimatiellia bacterium]
MENTYIEFLLCHGLKEYSSTGNRSTVYSYASAVKRVLRSEGFTWDLSPEEIGALVQMYGTGGEKEAAGRKSNCTVIRALIWYQTFIRSRQVK